MSVRIMFAVFDSQILAPTERLIMLSLADHADDEGRCYPSMARLCQRTGLSERAIQTNIRKLTERGYIRSVTGGGRNGTNVYFVNANPAGDAEYPAPAAVNPAGDAPKPSVTINNHQQMRERETAAASQQDPTDREKPLSAMGVGPDGITGPTGGMIGRQTDMAEADKWIAAGLELDAQCRVIREVCERQRSHQPGWMPRAFGYFSNSMADLVARRGAPMPAASVQPLNDQRALERQDEGLRLRVGDERLDHRADVFAVIAKDAGKFVSLQIGLQPDDQRAAEADLSQIMRSGRMILTIGNVGALMPDLPCERSVEVAGLCPDHVVQTYFSRAVCNLRLASREDGPASFDVNGARATPLVRNVSRPVGFMIGDIIGGCIG